MTARQMAVDRALARWSTQPKIAISSCAVAPFSAAHVAAALRRARADLSVMPAATCVLERLAAYLLSIGPTVSERETCCLPSRAASPRCKPVCRKFFAWNGVAFRRCRSLISDVLVPDRIDEIGHDRIHIVGDRLVKKIAVNGGIFFDNVVDGHAANVFSCRL